MENSMLWKRTDRWFAVHSRPRVRIKEPGIRQAVRKEKDGGRETEGKNGRGKNVSGRPPPAELKTMESCGTWNPRRGSTSRENRLLQHPGATSTFLPVEPLFFFLLPSPFRVCAHVSTDLSLISPRYTVACNWYAGILYPGEIRCKRR